MFRKGSEAMHWLVWVGVKVGVLEGGQSAGLLGLESSAACTPNLGLCACFPLRRQTGGALPLYKGAGPYVWNSVQYRGLGNRYSVLACLDSELRGQCQAVADDFDAHRPRKPVAFIPLFLLQCAAASSSGGAADVLCVVPRVRARAHTHKHRDMFGVFCFVPKGVVPGLSGQTHARMHEQDDMV